MRRPPKVHFASSDALGSYRNLCREGSILDLRTYDPQHVTCRRCKPNLRLLVASLQTHTYHIYCAQEANVTTIEEVGR